jgi:hypothetical protein
MLARLLLICLMMIATSARANSLCTMEPSLDRLFAQVRQYKGLTTLTSNEFQQLSAGIGQLNLGAIENWLLVSERQKLAADAKSLINTALDLADTGNVDLMVILQSQIRHFEVNVSALCGQFGNAEAKGENKSRLRMGEKGERKQSESRSSTPAPSGTANTQLLRMVTMIAIGMGIMGGLFLLLPWLKPRVFPRQGCRVRCLFFAGSEGAEGHIVVLARGGCTYESADRWAHERLERIEGTGPEELRIGNTTLPCRITSIDAVGAEMKFKTRLSIKEQQAILAGSVLRPYLVTSVKDAIHGNTFLGQLLTKLGLVYLVAQSDQPAEEEDLPNTPSHPKLDKFLTKAGATKKPAKPAAQKSTPDIEEQAPPSEEPAAETVDTPAPNDPEAETAEAETPEPHETEVPPVEEEPDWSKPPVISFARHRGTPSEG